MNEIQVQSTLDGTLQPSLFFRPEANVPVPLVVGLHTWSYDRFNQADNYLPLCRKYGWALLLPEFRGPNLASNPHCHDACGSLKARRDILDAVDHVLRTSAIDYENVFLLGCSGGGHAALLTAEDAPEAFRAVDVWCPVSDLTAWHAHLTETQLHYVHDMEACLGGGPADVPDEYAVRSPSEHLAKLRNLPVSVLRDQLRQPDPQPRFCRAYRSRLCIHGGPRLSLSPPAANAHALLRRSPPACLSRRDDHRIP